MRHLESFTTKVFRLQAIAGALTGCMLAIPPPVHALEDVPGESQRDGRKKSPSRIKKTTGAFFDKSGFGLRSDDSANEIRVGGFLQTGWGSQDGSKNNSTVETNAQHRALLTIDGKLGKTYSFRVAPNFGATTGILDTYVDANFTNLFKVRLGKFRVPFGLERMQSATALGFNGRAFPSDLVPNRDIGIQISGDMLKGVAEYQIGAFNGAVDNDAGLRHGGFNMNNDGVDFTGRVFFHPFKNSNLDALKGLGIGVAYSQGLQDGNKAADNSNLPVFRSPGQQAFAAYAAGAFANGTRERISPQLYYYNGPFGVLGEYVVSQQEVTSGITTHRVTNDALQVQLSWFVSNDKATFRRMVPKTPFHWTPRSWGAVELVARYSELNIDNDAFAAGLFNVNTSARRAENFGIGVNWHLNRHVKYQLNYDHTNFRHGAASGTDRPDEKALFTRLQITF